MTAEQLANKIRANVVDAHEGFMDANKAKQESIEAIKQCIKQKCKEQREKCNKEFGKIGYYPNAEGAILNAPEPEFD